LTQLVEAVDADSFRIDRRLLHLALGDANVLDPALGGVRGRMASDGFRLFRVPVGSLPAALGLKSGDRLTALNGRPLAGPEGLVAAYAELQRGAPATLSVLRGGRKIQLRYTFD
jgi:S1-C subfamily serine protease